MIKLKDLLIEGKLSEMNEPWFEITYKDSRGRKKTDSMRAKNPKEAKKDFVNLMKGRGFKVLKVVKEGKLTEISNKVIQNLKDTSGKMWDYYYQEKPAYVQPFNEPRGEKIKVKDIKDKKLKVKIKQLDKILREGKLTEKKKTIPLKDVPSYMKDHYPTQKHWDYYQSLPDGKKWMYYKKYPNILAKQSKKTDDFIAQQKKELGLEGKLTEKKFIPTVTIEKYGKEISVEKFKTTNDAKKYTKQMIKKYKLKWVKGFWGNPKTGIELTQNFS